MAITAQVLQKSFASILEKTGHDSYVPWEQFTKVSTKVVNSIDSLTKWLGILRQMQHKNFIQTMKKLKSLDIPDCIQSVQSKKLPTDVLKLIIPRFKLQNETVELVDSKETLKQQAENQYTAYKKFNEELIAEFQKYIKFLSTKALESGYNENQVTIADLQPFKSTMEFKLDQKKLKELSNKIKITFLPGTKFIDANTYAQVIDQTYEGVRDTFVDLVKKSRKDQRKNMSNPPVYYEKINAFFNNCESLIVQAQRQIYQNLGLDPSKWEMNEQSLLERGMGQLLMMAQGGLREKIKKSIPSTKQVSLQEATQVIKYQIRLLSQKNSEIKSILAGIPKGIESAQIVPMLLSLIFNDYIYEAFGYEEEDFMKNLNGTVLFTNPQLAQSFGKMEHQIMRLMQQLGVIPEDISNMMMGPQGDEMARMMAEMSGMNFDPSALQGMDFSGLDKNKKQPPM